MGRDSSVAKVPIKINGSVSVADFHRDPGAVVRQAQIAPVRVVGEQGSVRLVISCPSPQSDSSS